MSEAQCTWCGAPLRVEATDRYIVARCPVCGVGTTLPRPNPEQLAAAYGDWYRPAGGRFLLGADALLRRMRGRLARHLDAVAPAGPVLDVGAGDGGLLDALAATGREAVGLEPEPSRPDIQALDIEEVNGTWAAVVFWHTLEHLPRPAAALEAARDLLPPGGVVAIAVPNLDSLQARTFGERWLALDLPRHLVHLTAHALVERLEQLGFEVVRVSSWRGGQIVFGWLHGLVRALPGHLDLYDAIRRDAAQSSRRRRAARPAALVLGALVSPIALMCAVVEISVRRGGTVYVEARRG